MTVFSRAHTPLVEATQSIIRGETSNPHTILDSTEGERLLSLAVAHRLVPILSRYLTHPCWSDHPITSKTKSQARYIQHRNLLYINELSRMAEVFSSRQIQWISIKGPVLSAQLYGEPCLRTSSDLDIWVNPMQVLESTRALSGLGFELEEGQDLLQRRKKDFKFFRKEGAIKLELHWRLTYQDRPFLDWAAAYQAYEVQSLYGVGIPRLSDTDTFLYLCHHGFLHSWQRLQWLTDVARLIEISTPKARQLYIEEAIKRDRLQEVALAVFLIQRIWGSSAFETDARLNDSYESLNVKYLAALAFHSIVYGDENQYKIRHALRRVVFRLAGEGSLWSLVKSLNHWVMHNPCRPLMVKAPRWWAWIAAYFQLPLALVLRCLPKREPHPNHVRSL